MVMSGWSVHLTILIPGQACQSGKPVLRAHIFACKSQQSFLNQLGDKIWCEWSYLKLINRYTTSCFPIRTASVNSVESDHRFTSRIYLDNADDNVMLTLYNVTLTSQKTGM